MSSTPARPPTPLTVVTGFLGSGKTTLLLNLIPQLPRSYTLALLKNEFGDVAVDSQLAASASVAGVRELLNGCICCNLVGQLGDALLMLREGSVAAEGGAGSQGQGQGKRPDRIAVETSGSAFPATLVLEINRIVAACREGSPTGTAPFVLDGIVSVVDVENWRGYEDTSVTAKMQAKYTDMIVLNKWEGVEERRMEEVLDRLGDLESDVPRVWSRKGWVDKEVFLGLDGGLAGRGHGLVDGQRGLGAHGHFHGHGHEHGPKGEGHQGEVEVLSISLPAGSNENQKGVDVEKLSGLLLRAPKDEVYRIKAVLYASSTPKSSDGEPCPMPETANPQQMQKYILNWAFGRWTYTAITGEQSPAASEQILRMTMVTGLYESTKWKRRLESGGLIDLVDDERGAKNLMVQKVS